jgi:uncharacterized protein YndB with AHSA1/START domain
MSFTATSTTTIRAEPAAVWAALTDQDLVSKAFFGATVESDWRAGNPITFSGEWQGKTFRDHGEVVAVEPARKLEFTHFSPMTGQPDVPENYHVVTFDLAPVDAGTQVTITQTNAQSEEEQRHSEQNWQTVLASLKDSVEA